MLTESIFEQGSTHEICEDYAVHGDDYTIISDGCSNGGGPCIDTDWGSRIICKAAEERIKILDQNCSNYIAEFITSTGITAQTQLRLFPTLKNSCLTATLNVLKAQKDFIKSIVIGDGIVGGKHRNGNWFINVIEFVKGGSTGFAAPFYLKYKIFNETENYINKFGGNYKVTTYNGNLMDEKMEFPDLSIDEEERDNQWKNAMFASSFEHSLGNGYWETIFHIDDYEFVFNCSDGPLAFYQYKNTDTSKSKTSIHVMDVLRVLMDIRGNSPGFLRRQRNWAFKQNKIGTFKHRGWFGQDDVSIGVIRCHSNITL